MTAPIFDHDRLDVYRLSIDYVAQSFAIAKQLNGVHRHARADVIAESSEEYNAAVEYEYHFVEYVYEHEEQPEPRIAPKDAAPLFPQINGHRASSVNSTVLALNESYSYSGAAGTRTRMGGTNDRTHLRR